MNALELARQQYVARQLLARRAVLATRQAWRQIDPAAIRPTWHANVGPSVARIVTGAQQEAAGTAEGYTQAMLTLQGHSGGAEGTVNATAFSGTASDGRDLGTLLELSNVYALEQIKQGATARQGLAVGGNWLAQAVGTQVLDAGRTANGVALAARPEVRGYVRMLTPPSCGRCAVLAGRFYRWSAGFERHPRCDCLNVPVENVGWAKSEGFLSDPLEAFRSGNITGLSKADSAAIADGADIGQVINAHRGMYTADAYGQSVKATLEGTTKRGLAAARMDTSFQKVAGERYRRATSPRLRPEAIYRIAGNDRAEAIRLLQRFGYLI